MSVLKGLLFAVFTTSLIGCAAIQSWSRPYQEPLGDGLARLRVIINGTARLIPNSNCIAWDKPGTGSIASRVFALANDRTYNDRKLGIPADHELINASEVYLQPNEPFVLLTTQGNQYLNVTFVPIPNSDYEFYLDCSGRNCYGVLENISMTDGESTLKRIPVKYVRAETC